MVSSAWAAGRCKARMPAIQAAILPEIQKFTKKRGCSALWESTSSYQK
jgi:hypothetical protein